MLIFLENDSSNIYPLGEASSKEVVTQLQDENLIIIKCKNHTKEKFPDLLTIPMNPTNFDFSPLLSI